MDEPPKGRRETRRPSPSVEASRTQAEATAPLHSVLRTEQLQASQRAPDYETEYRTRASLVRPHQTEISTAGWYAFAGQVTFA